MKIRNGFVSNSSSSSFVLIKSKLTDVQYTAIINHIEFAKMLHAAYPTDEKYDFQWYESWNIREEHEVLVISTSMDNFDFYALLDILGVEPIQ